jgi:hypothetical protein
MTNNQQMMHWGRDWAVVNGFILCVHCSKGQMLAVSRERFVHDPECVVRNESEPHPWVALLEIVEREHG